MSKGPTRTVGAAISAAMASTIEAVSATARRNPGRGRGPLERRKSKKKERKRLVVYTKYAVSQPADLPELGLSKQVFNPQLLQKAKRFALVARPHVLTLVQLQRVVI